MQTHAPTTTESSGHASRPFFDPQSAAGPSFFSNWAAAPDIQRKCESCEEPPLIQPQLEVGAVDDPLEMEADAMADRVVRRQVADVGDRDPVSVQAKAGQAVQRKCSSCQNETRVMPQLEVGPVDDPLEVEADMMADRVVRRQAADRNEIQPQRIYAQANDADSSGMASGGLESSIAHASGSGAPLASHTRDQMEDAFGADFSGVRVHTSSSSAAMNEEIGARAFTYGSDIHFNTGEYAPGTASGTHLLAHELTHVMQQNSGVKRAPKRVQRKLLVFGPTTGIPSGTLIHNYGVLPQFVEGGLNAGVWTEPGIPGANKDRVGVGLRGEPDFYRSNGASDARIGLNQRRVGGFQAMNGAVAAPQRPLAPGTSVRDLDRAPHDIELGDLKPGHSPEEQLGRLQIRNYIKGIENTADAVNDYQHQNGHADRWNPLPKARPMSTLTVPQNLTQSSSAGTRYSKLDVWEWTDKARRHSFTSLMGSLIVYRSSVPGVWAYEWMPENVPETLGEDFDVQRLLDRLNNDVRPRLEAEQQVAPKLKVSKAAGRRSSRAVVRRKPKPHKKFNEKPFNDAYTKWRTDADKALGDKKSKDNEAVLEALSGGKKRTGFDPKAPQKVKDRAKGFHTVRHWIRYGKLYGWLRKTFDRVYVKLAGFGKWIKEKVKGLVKSASSSGFGNWIKAAAMALFKVAKKLGAWAISIIVDKLLDSLQEGVTNILRQLAEAVTPEAVKSKIEELEEAKARFETMIQEATETIEKKLFGDKLDMFTKLSKYMEIANTVSTIVSVVKWGIRIVACASPPLLGCLWNLAVAALEYAFSKIMQTCWFGAKVMGWVRDSGIQAILDFPTEVASHVAKGANEFLPKLPEGIGPYFAEIKVNHNEFKMDCKGGGDSDSDGGGSGGGGGGGEQEPTEEQKALMDLAKEVGDEKMEAFLEMAAKRAADYNVQLDAERIKKLGELIKSLTVDQMKAIAQQQIPKDGIPVPLEEFLKSISKLTPQESKRKEDRKIDYDKAQKNNPVYERSQIGWKPELFVQSGVSSDSADFADAIYDIQKLLGLKPDGMAGPSTTKLYYEFNKQGKDQAYANASKLVEKEEQAKADAKANAEHRKEMLALLNDEKVKAAMAAPFPSEAELKKDLSPLHWENLDDNSAQFIRVNGRAVVGIKTEEGHSMGAYFHFVERDFNGEKMQMIVKTSKFFAVDKIGGGEGLSYRFSEKDSDLGIGFLVFKGAEKGTFFDLGDFFFGKHVVIQ
ncbi:MAG TPA: DUF4157 domain-containing protein [Steroidobacteraceae bacterium]|nr:DUF4157 domain-containing protein [Steroidobacteraceae bacterium]